MKNKTEARGNNPPSKKKRLNRNERRALVFLILMFGIICQMIAFVFVVTVKSSEKAEEKTTAEAEAITTEYIISDGVSCSTDVPLLTSSWSAEAGLPVRYELTDAERREIASVVTAEAEGEPYAGKVAVAQCILQSAEDDGIRPGEVLIKYGYSSARPTPCIEAMEAVADVFDFGAVATKEPIKYFYAPARRRSDWHESQVHVLTINNHKFFKEASM
ncbi:MAG: hypothetical protein J6Q59_04485 [Paludibacteraceae bacterium]|nr:hypothetical protein [Paludibacteraceae bacterium]